jgi:hypothetical protein
LVELNLDRTGDFEEGHHPVTSILNVLLKFNPARSKLAHGFGGFTVSDFDNRPSDI